MSIVFAEENAKMGPIGFDCLQAYKCSIQERQGQIPFKNKKTLLDMGKTGKALSIGSMRHN
jgi:hypothetical protein